MAITYSNGISILELIVYFPSLFAAAYLVWLHGIRTSGGFLFLLLFVLLRITGACCDLAAINNPSVGLYIAQAICSSIGLSPLILACSGLLSRANNSINEKPNGAISERFFHLLRIITLVALILSIVGITKDMTPKALLHPNSEIKAGMNLFVVSWAALCLLLFLLIRRRSGIEMGERRLLLVVGISATLILVRLIYAMLMFFLADSTFNFFNGSTTAMLVMSVLEEIGVVLVCLGVGLTLRVRGKGLNQSYSGVPLYESGPPPYNA
ncbi:hypothetical protein PHISCL_08327 [Aspergillus sclerotialis]|uniref:DUF7702 domain-containing protein n=1 Tax=Aspergillus sclerotialis TaxID=2070753 RepID=A0A3A2Z8U4_9EURO|nr:hypothetical protein PHISCL_08327 [Aspergillus sclerotialis]